MSSIKNFNKYSNSSVYLDKINNLDTDIFTNSIENIKPYDSFINKKIGNKIIGNLKKELLSKYSINKLIDSYNFKT